MTKTPSRILNERIGFWGLSVTDIGVIGYTLIILNKLLKPMGLELLAFPATFLMGFVLLGIRLKFRPKIIRDFVAYSLRKSLGPGRHGLDSAIQIRSRGTV